MHLHQFSFMQMKTEQTKQAFNQALLVRSPEKTAYFVYGDGYNMALAIRLLMFAIADMALPARPGQFDLFLSFAQGIPFFSR
jgi:hypothetical protein